MQDHISTLHNVFAATARRHPELPAVELSASSISYAELERAAEALAESVTAAYGRVRSVALLAARSGVAYAGYLAALRLGAQVVPLNLKYPPRRNTAICELADVDVIIADASGQQWLEHCPSGTAPARPVLPLTDEELLAAVPDGSLPLSSAGPDDIAYLLFTSGSTGRPKGVPIRHRNVLAFLAHTVPRYEVGPGCRMSHTFDLTFDLSVYDLFVTWGGGATLVVPEAAELLSPVDYAVNRRLTHWFSVPSAVSAAAGLGGLSAGRVPGLRYSVFCGEQFTYAQAEAWSGFASESVVENIYGPTELTLACAEFRLPKERRDWPETVNDTVPIGVVYPGLEYVVTDDGELCPRSAAFRRLPGRARQRQPLPRPRRRRAERGALLPHRRPGPPRRRRQPGPPRPPRQPSQDPRLPGRARRIRDPAAPSSRRAGGHRRAGAAPRRHRADGLLHR